jgi:phosphoribosylaminoimidazole-succinocarboxamide synthase
MEAQDVTELLRGFGPGKVAADGKSKTLHVTPHPDVCLMEFKPHARSLTSRREEDVPGSDSWRLLATLEVLRRLEADGIATHLRFPHVIRHAGRLYLAVSRARPIPIEWIVRYEAAGSIVRLFPGLVREGQRFARPLFKYDYKQDVKVAGVDDPTLNESYIVGLGLLDEAHLRAARDLLAAVGDRVRQYLHGAGMRLIDMKTEFGFDAAGRLLVIDEISQDCIRAADAATDRPLTKDVFRQLQSPEEVVGAYEVFARRLNPTIEELVWDPS